MTDIIYGIDLGTTFSAIAWVHDLEPKCLPLEGREKTIPSAVLFKGPHSVCIGQSAIDDSWMDGTLLVEFAKRTIGLSNCGEWEYGDWKYFPEDISALVLKKIRQIVSDSDMPEPCEVVVTHPQYFGMNQKEATKIACELAGLNPVGTINEPTAAAIAHTSFDPSRSGDRTVLIFDLGGGTFDVVLMQLGRDRLDVIAHAGDARHGGMDWDKRIMDIAKEQFKLGSGIDFDSVATPHENIDLRKEAEKAKRRFSDEATDKYPITVLAGGDNIKTIITRADFEHRCRNLVEHCVEMCGEMLQRHGRSWKTIDDVVLVGSSVKMPMIQKAVRSVSGRDDIRPSSDPKSLVAKGAALWGHWIKRGEVNPRWAEPAGSPGTRPDSTPSTSLEVPHLHGLTVHGLGVLVARGDHEYVDILIPANTQTPHVMEKVYHTAHDNAPSLLVPLFEGDSEERNDSTSIGLVEIDGLPLRPRGQPVAVKFKIDLAGRLEVDVKMVETGESKRVEISREFTERTRTADGGRPSMEQRRRRLAEISIDRNQ